MRKVLYIPVLFFLIFFSCRTGKISTSNLSYLYDRDMISYIPDYSVYHLNDTISRIYYRFNSGSLLYVKELNEDHFSAKYSFQTQLYESYDMKSVLDSNAVIFTDYDNKSERNIYGTIDVMAPAGNDYLMKFTFNDLNKHTSVELFIDINKSNVNSQQNFLLLDSDSLPAFTYVADSSSEFRLQCNNSKLQKLFVGYYDRIFPIASLPFSMVSNKPFEYAPDSLFTISVNNGISQVINFPYKGFYHFQSDTSQTSGITLFRFYDDFPKITAADQMLYSLRYLTSKYEYDDLATMKNKKEAVEKFWIDLAGNADRAKEMIKLYYNRVQCANRYFTSYLEGWKTDRGLIYIIYGMPNIVYRSDRTESWIYGEDRNMLSITFTFTKVKNPFTENDYSLSRSPAYKDGWYIAVDNWRR
ncbi:MAG: GWxTD domain-containing protein [Bacteroidota bacterium]